MEKSTGGNMKKQIHIVLVRYFDCNKELHFLEIFTDYGKACKFADNFERTNKQKCVTVVQGYNI